MKRQVGKQQVQIDMINKKLALAEKSGFTNIDRTGWPVCIHGMSEAVTT